MATNELNDCLLVSEASNFRSIFAHTDNGHTVKKVVIPLVQRDYAQGRQSPEVKRIRARFLQVLYEALTEDKKTTLDFIYGNVDENGRLIPLDGQQRLTTLFLLHYYIARHEAVDEREMAFLDNFTYETRVSSREFCENLLSFKPDFSHPIAEQVSDEAWFLLEWENDPTVQSMLVMLDAIHDKFKGTCGLWEKLMGDNISFYFLPLSQMGVTDELYIKMNSRGKALTRFEHFKAEMELNLKQVDAEKARQIMRKIDREWTDLLWPFRDSGTGDNEKDSITDDEFLRYVRFISDIISYKNEEPEIKDEFDIIERQFSKSSPSVFENMELLERFFDIWKDIDIEAFFDGFISNDGYAPGKISIDTPKNIFRECCRCYGIVISRNRSAFTLVQTILLYSFIQYLLNKECISEADFRRRLRIINNLAKNSSDTVRTENMKVLLELTDKVILHGIVERSEGRARFQTKQVEEEIKKLEWTTLHPDMAETLFRLEDHPYLNGYISSVGLEHVDWCDRFYSLFKQDLNNVNRALLSVEDCFVKDSWRYQIGTSNNRLSLGVWRDIFGPVKLQSNLSNAVKALLYRFDFFRDEMLQKISWDYLQYAREMPVRYYLVKYSQMMPNRWGKYYWRGHEETGRNNYHVLMMMTEFSTGGMNYDIFLKALFDIAGREKVGLSLGQYSYSEYNNHGTDKLYLRSQGLYLTLNDNRYAICQIEGDEVVESYDIQQNERGIDIEDRVLAGLRLLNKYLQIYDEDTIGQYIARCDWTFAKTMPQWPHEYIVKEKCSLTKEEFEHFVWTQRVLGKVEDWGPYRQPYLYLDGYKYWTMGCELEATTVINRAKISERNDND